MGAFIGGFIMMFGARIASDLPQFTDTPTWAWVAGVAALIASVLFLLQWFTDREHRGHFLDIWAERSNFMARSRDILYRELPPWLNAILVFGTLATVVYFEIKRPLRKARQDKISRDARNAFMSLTTAATISLTEKPVTVPLSRAVEKYGFGLIKLRRLPVWADVLLSVALLDYTLYIWHYLTHKVPFLWRFHLAHHVDMDLDASTALRFHAGEMLLSVPWRATQVAVLGISPFSLALWQTLTLMEIMFHHSNVRLPYDVERRLCRLIVTPRMHGIHHSVVRKETDSNWSTIFSWPDYLHGTIRLNVPQDRITIGVLGYQRPEELTVGKILKLPFKVDRPSWRTPQGEKLQREQIQAPATSLSPDGVQAEMMPVPPRMHPRPPLARA